MTGLARRSVWSTPIWSDLWRRLNGNADQVNSRSKGDGRDGSLIIARMQRNKTKNTPTVDRWRSVVAVLITARNAAMNCFRRAMIFGRIAEARYENLNQAASLSCSWTTLLEALHRYRGKCPQKVTAKHVHAHNDEQSLIGTAETRGVDGNRGNNPMQADFPMHRSPRCCAKTRHGMLRQAPAMAEGRRHQFTRRHPFNGREARDAEWRPADRGIADLQGPGQPGEIRPGAGDLGGLCCRAFSDSGHQGRRPADRPRGRARHGACAGWLWIAH